MPTLPFFKLSEEGSHYAIGYGRGKLAASDPLYLQFLTTSPAGTAPLSDGEAERRLCLLEQCCPGMRDELRGLADALGVPPQQLAQLSLGVNQPARGCSLLAVAPARTVNGRPLLARSYEYDTQDELIYSVTRVPGCYAHAGFSLFQAGRMDGMNEKGLCVAIASCQCVHPAAGEGEGVAFWVAVRRLLDTCASVREGLQTLLDLPLGDNTNYILMDAGGDCAIVETLSAGGKSTKAVRRGGEYLYALNHYLSAEHTARFPKRKRFSAVRQEAIEHFFTAHDKVSLDDLKTLLSARLPDGLCCHAYSDCFGTLRSMLFDPAEGRLSVCLGSPASGVWFDADLHAPAGCTTLSVPYTDEPAPPDYWQEI